MAVCLYGVLCAVSLVAVSHADSPYPTTMRTSDTGGLFSDSHDGCDAAGQGGQLPTSATHTKSHTVAHECAAGRYTAGTVGIIAGTAAMSSTHSSTNAASMGNDGDLNTMAHTMGGTGETNPWWQIDFGSSKLVGSITFHNRPGNCGSRLFEGWNCAWSVSSSSYTGTNQGARFGVGDTSCSGDTCSSPQCGRLTTYSSGAYTITCDPPLRGRYAYVMLPGSNRMLNFQEFQAHEFVPHCLSCLTGQYSASSDATGCQTCPTGSFTTGPSVLLFQGTGSSGTHRNSWSGWYDGGSVVTDGNGKRVEYDTTPLVGLRLEDVGGHHIEYALRSLYAGMTMLEIVEDCMASDAQTGGNSNTQTWQDGHCTIADVVSFNDPDDKIDNNNGAVGSLRVGVGDGQNNQGDDWALFMPVSGNGGGDYDGRNIYNLGGEIQTNNGYTGTVYLTGIPIDRLTLLFQGTGSSSTHKNSWTGWYAPGSTVTGGNGKRGEYDTMPLSGLRVSDSSGAFVQYVLRSVYAGRSMLAIVQECINGAQSAGNTNAQSWQDGHCTIADVVLSANISNAAPLRIGVGDGQVDAQDWALFMPVSGNGNGDFAGRDIWALGGERQTNNGHTGAVFLHGIASFGSSACSPCSAGWYGDQPGIRESQCKACSAGSFTDTAGSTACAACGPGTFASTSNATGCLPCAAGTYSRQNGTVLCDACVAGFFSSALASTSCGTCGAGSYTPPSGNVTDMETFCWQHEGRAVTQADLGAIEFVRRAATGEHWHQATDNLAGTAVYGSYSPGNSTMSSAASFSVAYDINAVTHFLFVSGDGERWLAATKDSVLGQNYDNSRRPILCSSALRVGYLAAWYNRAGYPSDPWISIADHGNDETTVYMENSYSGQSMDTVLDDHDGANVFVTLGQPSDLRTSCMPCSNGTYANTGDHDGGGIFDIRLVNGAHGSEGRLEIYYNNEWGTVCDDYFTAPDAAVACRQLGYTDGVEVGIGSFGKGVGEIWLDDVHCVGTESRLDECDSNPIGTHNCNHNEDVGLQCWGPRIGGAPVGNRGCRTCRAGSYTDAAVGATSCTGCALGTYSAQTGLSHASQCTQCGGGSYTGVAQGSTSCHVCLRGTFSIAASSTCTACEAGKYSAEDGATVCESCVAGQYAPNQASTSCLPCSTGYTPGCGQDLLLFEALGSSSTYKNSWQGWYASGSNVSSGAGKRVAYDTAPLVGLYLESQDGRYTGYHLQTPYTDRALLDIVQECMNGTQTSGNTNTQTWRDGHCTVGDLVDSNGITNAAPLRIGVGDGQNNMGDWALFMPLSGNGNGDYNGFNIWAFGGETQTNNGYTAGLVRMVGCLDVSLAARACVACGLGTYNNGSAPLFKASQCSPCLRGQYSDVPGGACKTCEAAKYQDITGATGCQFCPDGTYLPPSSNPDDHDSVNDCTPCGFGASDYRCSVGYHKSGQLCVQSSTDTQSCSICGYGGLNYTCPPGYSRGDDGTLCPGNGTTDTQTCIPCPVNTYNNGSDVRARECVRCPQHTSTQGMTGRTNQSSCFCDAGYRMNQRTMKCEIQSLCPLSNHTNGTGNSSQEAQCVEIGPCSERFDPDEDSCYNFNYCSPGTWTDVASSNCLDCSEGTFNDEFFASSCKSCLMGTYADRKGSKDCTPCEKGKYQGERGRDGCQNCPTGQFADTQGTSQCKNCDQGTFAADEESRNCETCSTGTFQDLVGQSDCKLASVGHSVEGNGAAAEKLCSVGMYQDLNGQGQCKSCIKGTFQDELGQTGCRNASVGHYVDFDRQPRQQTCSKGTYAPVVGLTRCDDCGDGFFSNSTGLSACFPAERGYTATGTRQWYQTLCPAGSAAHNNSGTWGCQLCQKGTFTSDEGEWECYPARLGYMAASEGLRDDTACEPGFYSDQVGLDACERCAEGHFQPDSGKSFCAQASAGYYVGQMGAHNHTICPRGTAQSAIGQPECPECSRGQYQPSAGSTACIMAAPGYYVGQTGAHNQTMCDAGTAQATPGQPFCPFCTRGQFQPSTGGALCMPTHPGHYVAGSGATEETPCDEGTEQGDNQAVSCRDCTAGRYANETGMTACVGAEPGFYAPGGRQKAQLPCPPGSVRPATANADSCEVCAVGQFQPDPRRTACITCPGGSHTNGSFAGAVACLSCNAGTYSLEGRTGPTCAECGRGYRTNANLTQCDICEQGQFSDHISSTTSCQQCRVGMYIDSAGASGCKACKPGTYADQVGQDDCKACIGGQFQNRSGQAGCQPAPLGMVVGALGQDTPTMCLPGTRMDLQAQQICKQCGKGQFQDQARQADCNECTLGMYSDSPGFTECRRCSVGHSINLPGQDACVPCAQGHFQDQEGQATCREATRGSVVLVPGQSTETDCEPGFYQDEAGQVGCKECPAGKFQNLRGHDQVCTPCDAGRYADSQGQSACKECEAGKYSDQSASELCSACSSGWYQNETSTTSCIAAAPGRYVQSLGQTFELPCPQGEFQDKPGSRSCLRCQDARRDLGFDFGVEYTTLGEGSSTCDRCVATYYRDGPNCTQCEPEMLCDSEGTTLSALEVKPGFWRIKDGREVVACPKPDGCKVSDTEAQTKTSKKNQAEVGVTDTMMSCAEGYTGPLCAVCAQDWFSQVVVCKPCDMNDSYLQGLVATLAAVIFAVIAIGVAVSRYTRRVEAKSHSQRDVFEKKYMKWKDAMQELKRSIAQKLKTIYVFGQVVSSFSWSLEVTYPQPATDALRYISAFSIDIDFIPLDCFNRVDALEKLVVVTITPVVLIILLGVLVMITSAFACLRKTKKNLTTAIYVILYLVFPYASAVIFKSLRPCHSLEDGSKHMHEDYGTDCNSERYNLIQMLAIIMVLVYPIGVPMFFYLLLRLNKDKIRQYQDAKYTVEKTLYDTRAIVRAARKIDELSGKNWVSSGADFQLWEGVIKPILFSLSEELNLYAWDTVRNEMKDLFDVNVVLQLHPTEHKDVPWKLSKTNDVVDACVLRLRCAVEKLAKHSKMLEERFKGLDLLREYIVEMQEHGPSQVNTKRKVKKMSLGQLKALALKEHQANLESVDEEGKKAAGVHLVPPPQPWYKGRPWSFLFKYYNVWWWEVFESYRRVCLSGGLVLFPQGSAPQLLVGLLLCLSSLKVFINTKPMIEKFDNTLYGRSLWATLIVMIMGVLLKVDTGNDGGSFDNSLYGTLLAIMTLAVPFGIISYMILTLRKGFKEERDMVGISGEVRRRSKFKRWSVAGMMSPGRMHLSKSSSRAGSGSALEMSRLPSKNFFKWSSGLSSTKRSDSFKSVEVSAGSPATPSLSRATMEERPVTRPGMAATRDIESATTGSSTEEDERGTGRKGSLPVHVEEAMEDTIDSSDDDISTPSLNRGQSSFRLEDAVKDPGATVRDSFSTDSVDYMNDRKDSILRKNAAAKRLKTARLSVSNEEQLQEDEEVTL